MSIDFPSEILACHERILALRMLELERLRKVQEAGKGFESQAEIDAAEESMLLARIDMLEAKRAAYNNSSIQ